MIVKNFEINKIDNSHKIFLLYGDNEGLKNEVIEKKFKKKYTDITYLYDENEILKNQESFFNQILSKSFLKKKN